LQKGSACAS